MRIIPYQLIPQAVVRGGLHGRPRGTVAGIVYGAARSREGKVVTAREYVIPGATDDEDVLNQRIVFKSMVMTCQYLAAECWKVDFDRAVGQLPGFHSLMSVLLKNTPHATGILAAPPATPLGNLYAPTFTVIPHASTPGSITITWGAEHGINGTDADPFVAFIVNSDQSAIGHRYAVYKGEIATRVDGTIDIATGASATDWCCCCYFHGAGTALGNISPARWYDVTSAS